MFALISNFFLCRCGSHGDTSQNTTNVTAAPLAENPIAELPTEGYTLVIIDPQVDFHAGGSLAVEGAVEDSARIAEMIRKNIDKIQNITVTLDSHNPDHIAHALFWSDKEDGAGTEPTPFMQISSEDLIQNKWFPKDIKLKDYCIDYAKQLETKGRFKLTIWPAHCLIGSHGQEIYPSLKEALNEWEAKRSKKINLVNKGMNNFTEMYSAIEAEVPYASDPQTFANQTFLNELKTAKKVIICGQALSHCVNYTTRASSVYGCQEAGELFLSDMEKEGVTIKTCVDAFEGL
eukprot:gene12217-16367_t